MSFQYTQLSRPQLEEIADVVLNRYSHRCSGCLVDIEGIVEDAEIEIIPRQGGLIKYVEGYAAHNPRYIIVPEVGMSYSPRYRPVVAEEFCHIVLEYDFLKCGLPLEAHADGLTAQQHADIEADARYLSLAILFPRSKFTIAFNQCLELRGKSSADRDKNIRACGETLENKFQVWSLLVGSRARDLALITPEECKRNFSNRLLM